MTKRTVCADCKNLKKDMIGEFGFPLYGCLITGHVIPHGTNTIDDKHVTIFWRIPITCPLPNSEVTKSLDKAPESEWITI